MNAPVFARVGQRFITGVDDGAVVLYPAVKFVWDVVGTLRQLKVDFFRFLVGLVDIVPVAERLGIAGTGASGSGIDLPRDQERSQHAQVLAVVELECAADQVIFVTPEGGVGFQIHVVLDEGNLIRPTEVFQCVLHHHVACAIISHQVGEVGTLRRCVFKMTHVEVDAPAIHQKTAVARRFVVGAVVQIEHTLFFVEDMVFDPDRNVDGSVLEILFLDQQTVLGLNSVNAAFHDFTHTLS